MKFVIIDEEHFDKIDICECNESIHTLKTSIDLSEVIISYNNDQPQFCFDISEDDIGLEEYTIDEIVEILNTLQWTLLS